MFFSLMESYSKRLGIHYISSLCLEFGPAICLEFGIKMARNTLYTIEHINGTNNYIPDFLSREHFQNLCLLISVQLRNGVETIVNIPDSLSWESYAAEWVPH
jgi:hypothetical protein